jgi:hypothetical protein
LVLKNCTLLSMLGASVEIWFKNIGQVAVTKLCANAAISLNY